MERIRLTSCHVESKFLGEPQNPALCTGPLEEACSSQAAKFFESQRESPGQGQDSSVTVIFCCGSPAGTTSAMQWHLLGQNLLFQILCLEKNYLEKNYRNQVLRS